MNRYHLSEWGAELAGTAILMLGGLSAVALDFGRGSPVAAAIPSVSAALPDHLQSGPADGDGHERRVSEGARGR
jgi:hypothetical protein